MNRRTNLLASTIVFALLMVFGLMFLTGLTTQAATEALFTVNDDGDSGNNNCGDTNCTLRDAIVDANASPGADTIIFDLNPNSTITLDGTQLPAISGTLTIIGPGEGDLTVSAANLSRIFEINSGQSVTITGMTIRDGDSGSSGGGILNFGSLVLQNTMVTSSTASSGGGIYNLGSLYLQNSAATGNIADVGGGIYNFSSASLTIDSSEISDNIVSSQGGGIYLDNGSFLTVTHSSLVGNSAVLEGGAIFEDVAEVTIMSSTIQNNSSSEKGGALFGAGGTVSIKNSTVYSNSAVIGGGIALGTGATVTFTNNTLSNNRATTGPGGIFVSAPSTAKVYLRNTIIANNVNGDCSINPANLSSNIKNLIEDNSCSPEFNGDPDLGPLANNGGDTLTMMPGNGSPVIDMGNNATCELTDQRGVARPQDGDDNSIFVCDIGAVEVVGKTLTVNKTADTNDGVCSETDCTLREAIGTSNARAGANTIIFASSLPASSVITLVSQLPVITDTVTIDGSTAMSLTVSGDNKYRVFEIGSGTTVTMTNMTLANGDLSGGSSCPDACGAGILNGGQLALDRMIISNNDAYQGGGVYVAIGGVMTMTQGDLMHNSATDGGGIYNWGRSSVNLSTISNNTATNGGGVYNTASGWIESIDVTIKDNLAGISGGGIYNFGKLTLRRNTVFNNGASTANGVGGGVYILQTGQLTMTNSTVSSNSAFWGGGVANTGQSNIRNSTLSDNLATVGGGLWINSFGVLYFSNSIIANSQVGVDCSSGRTIPVSNNINNLVETGNCSALFSDDPKLQPLDYYGGETRTQAIPVESPAYNKGDNVTCEAKDQRGVSRPQDGACDIGAFEYRGGTSVYLPLVIKQ